VLFNHPVEYIDLDLSELIRINNIEGPNE